MAERSNLRKRLNPVRVLIFLRSTTSTAISILSIEHLNLLLAKVFRKEYRLTASPLASDYRVATATINTTCSACWMSRRISTAKTDSVPKMNWWLLESKNVGDSIFLLTLISYRYDQLKYRFNELTSATESQKDVMLIISFEFIVPWWKGNLKLWYANHHVEPIKGTQNQTHQATCQSSTSSYSPW